jgi:hypothetical protein
MNDKLEVLMKQYEMLENYSTLTVPNNRNNILSFGLASLSAILTGNIILLTATGKEVLSGIIFILLPTLSISILFLWLGEVHRMVRAGLFLMELEKKINVELKEDVLHWEQYITQPAVRIRYPEIFVIFLLLGASLFFPLFGVFIMRETLCWKYLIGIPIADILIHLVIAYLIYSRIIVRLR